jgi:phospholipid/cholesterol/gamma-HCH transport system substrate-binding protein
MSQTRHEWKVGLWVLSGIVLLMCLLVLFSKGFSFTPTYTLQLKAASSGILKRRAPVAIAGVPIGWISDIRLAPDSKSVTMVLKIQSAQEIRSDARFVIEASGFLGDQFITVIPVDNSGTKLKDGDTVTAEAPFDLQEVARSAQKFILHWDDTAKQVNSIIQQINRQVLNENTLSNLTASVAALHEFSEEALVVADNLHELVQTNAAPIAAAVQNIQATTTTLSNLVADVQAGRGTAGILLKDDAIANNLKEVSANLSATSSNLAHYGLWHVLWKPSLPTSNTTASGKPRP